MGNTYADRQKDDENDSVYISESKQWLAKGAKPGRTLILKLIHPETRCNWLQEQFFKLSHGQVIRIPKHLESLDEKYLRRCLEVIHMNASKGVPCALSVNLSSLDMVLMSDHITASRRNSLDETKYAIDYPMNVGNELNLVINPTDEEIVGSIMGSDSMMSILRSPLFKRLCISGHEAHDATLGGPSQKPGKEALVIRDQDYSSDQSSASFSCPSYSQGMIQCTWKDGIPHFAFSLDDQKELYVANAGKVKVTDGKALDYVYFFYLRPNGQKMSYIYDHESDLIGKMKVSTSFSLSPSDSKIMETEFVLVGADKNHAREMRALTQNSRRSRKLFKSGHSIKQRKPSIFEDFSSEKALECRCDISESDYLPNLEMAAIVVKNHLQEEDCKKGEVGGWGLRFLKKVGVKQNKASSDACASSTSMDIIVPAGPHGGPRTRNGGPTSLVERWRLGGCCDCGGWDIGCPLKVLKARPRREEIQHSSEAPVDCKSFDLFTEGSKQGKPTVKMVNIHDNLYFISFQSSSLSALQCFSIAVAIVHSQSPTLRPKHVQLQD